MEKKMANPCHTPIPSQTTAEVLVSPETNIGSNGLRKKMLQKGVSWQTPIPSDEVEDILLSPFERKWSNAMKKTGFRCRSSVSKKRFKNCKFRYNVSLQEGEYFDSSREEGTPFRFKLGQCEVEKGWYEGIATMRKGDDENGVVVSQSEEGSELILFDKWTSLSCNEQSCENDEERRESRANYEVSVVYNGWTFPFYRVKI